MSGEASATTATTMMNARLTTARRLRRNLFHLRVHSLVGCPPATAASPVAVATGCSMVAIRSLLSSPRPRATGDRKSTRLNSSHVAISYAVFCLKKKKKNSKIHDKDDDD